MRLGQLFQTTRVCAFCTTQRHPQKCVVPKLCVTRSGLPNFPERPGWGIAFLRITRDVESVQWRGNTGGKQYFFFETWASRDDLREESLFILICDFDH
jgi:hypothetical protein